MAKEIKNISKNFSGYIDTNNVVKYGDSLNEINYDVENTVLDKIIQLEEQINNFDGGNNENIDAKQDKVDNNLQTTDKTIVGAINELFQSANNGKELIASAIGEPLSSNQTFQAMSNDIDSLL